MKVSKNKSLFLTLLARHHCSGVLYVSACSDMLAAQSTNYVCDHGSLPTVMETPFLVTIKKKKHYNYAIIKWFVEGFNQHQHICYIAQTAVGSLSWQY